MSCAVVICSRSGKIHDAVSVPFERLTIEYLGEHVGFVVGGGNEADLDHFASDHLSHLEHPTLHVTCELPGTLPMTQIVCPLTVRIDIDWPVLVHHGMDLGVRDFKLRSVRFGEFVSQTAEYTEG